MTVDNGRRAMVRRLFDAFNHRDADAITELCDDEMEFITPTAEMVGRDGPYVGPDGLREYLVDVARSWEELLVTAGPIEQSGSQLLVRGRVYARSREFGIRDMPVAWVWEVRDGRFVRGEVFPNPEEAVARATHGSD